MLFWTPEGDDPPDHQFTTTVCARPLFERGDVVDCGAAGRGVVVESTDTTLTISTRRRIRAWWWLRRILTRAVQALYHPA